MPHLRESNNHHPTSPVSTPREISPEQREFARLAGELMAEHWHSLVTAENQTDSTDPESAVSPTQDSGQDG